MATVGVAGSAYALAWALVNDRVNLLVGRIEGPVSKELFDT